LSTKRKRQRTGKSSTQRARRAQTDAPNRGIRPWVLPGIAGIAVIAIVLLGVFTLSSDDGNSTAAADVPSPSLGDRTAQVVIHEYGDYQCPFCGRFARTVKPEIQERYIDTGVARLVWHDLTWHGRESRTAANAARCAGDQDQFWEYHDLLFSLQRGENDGTYSNERLKEYGDAMGLEPDAFHSCVDSNVYEDAIDADLRRGRQLGISGKPSFVIGEQRVVGAQPLEVFEQAIRTELQQQG
jgi:protein-disulfide isomerase